MSGEKVNYEVVSPLGEPVVEQAASATRIADLNGKTVCQVWNAGFRADQVFSALSELLKKRFPDIKVIPWTELPTATPTGDIDKIMRELREAYLQKRCDAVITSTGG